jgi:hypothetical protein
MKQWANAALGRVHPGMLIGVGLVAVALAFGAVGLAILGADGSGVDDLDLGAPAAPLAEGDAASGDAPGGGAADGESLSAGLTAHERDATATRVSEGAGAEAEGGPGGAIPGTTETHRAAASEPTTTSTAGDAGPGATTPSSTSSSTVPPSTSTTALPTGENPGLLGGLLDLLGLG